jgi:predicted molibdopterin-dependent oxidoreductase YjgC
VSADLFQITVDGVAVVVPKGISVAAALMNAELPIRTSVNGEPRAALCGMGICQECRISIDGRAYQRACMIAVEPGMTVARHG